MRVISGTAKGRKLKAPPGLHTRPITDMIKEALFNVWGSRVIGAAVLDLFAGSGSVGIEALSRGAEQVVFVDNAVGAVKTIHANLLHCQIPSGYDVLRSDVLLAIKRLAGQKSSFDLIYIDPPFVQEDLFELVMDTLSQAGILADEGIIVIRTPRNRDMPSFPPLRRYRHKIYGESGLHYYGRGEEVPENDGDISHS